MRVRETAVSGGFYPDDRRELNRKLNRLLGNAKKKKGGRVKILIVPHAGIDYSGEIAAWGYKQFDKGLKTVILLGVSHRQSFGEAKVDNSDVWKTPLGVVRINKKVVSRLTKRTGIIEDSNVHRDEHSLEMQVIWLENILEDYKIVPILLSNINEELIKGLNEELVRVLGEPNTILVVSTDLSHYPKYRAAREADGKVVKAILSRSRSDFDSAVDKVEKGGYGGLQTAACGKEAVRVALEVGKSLGLNWKLLKYANSGDAGGDKKAVVGYVAIGGYDNIIKNKILNKKYFGEAIEIARGALEGYLKTGVIPELKVKYKELVEKRGVFVTLKKGGELRGCIGEIKPKEGTGKLIAKMTVAAAMDDPRFEPISLEELPEIEIEVSLLTPLKRIEDWRKIELGKQGVVIEKDEKKGVFLPQVAEETGWDLEEFMARLCLKARLASGDYKERGVKIWGFEVEKISEKPKG